MDKAFSDYIGDKYMKPIAEKIYQREIRQWEAKIEQEEDRNAERLRNPDFVASLGLPPNLPRFTRDILKKAMAVDKIGPQKPQVDKIYGRFGL